MTAWNCLFVGCLTSQQHASVSQGRICSDNFTCCHTEIEVADQTFHLTQSQYTDTGPTSPSADPITPGAWQGSHWSANFCHWYDSTPKKSRCKRDSNPGPSAPEADALTTRPTRRSDSLKAVCRRLRLGSLIALKKFSRHLATISGEIEMIERSKNVSACRNQNKSWCFFFFFFF